MKSTRRNAPSGFFQGSEMPRMMGMTLLLFVLVMLMGQSADPRLWQWLVEESEPSDFGTAATAKASKHIATQNSPAKSDKKEPVAEKPVSPEKSAVEKPAEKPAVEAKPEAKQPEAKKPEDKPEEAPEEKPMDGGATEEDPEQQEAIKPEFEAITDRGLNMRQAEMHAYWRLFLWADSQSYEQLLKKARRDVVFNDFDSRPDDMRGKLVRLKLNLRRVLAHPAPDNPVFTKQVYELWGWSDESKAWLYEVVTIDLPPDMPIGPDIHETVVFVGYFLKLQGYHEAGAKPNARPLSAPLLVGKIEWKPSPNAKKVGASDGDGNWWIWVVAVTIVVLGAARIAAPAMFGAMAGMTPGAQRPLPDAKELRLGNRFQDEEEPPEWEVPNESWRSDSQPDDWKKGKTSSEDADS